LLDHYGYVIIVCNEAIEINNCLITCYLQLSQIKADLKDVLYSHKWTPDAYLIARAYIDDEER